MTPLKKIFLDTSLLQCKTKLINEVLTLNSLPIKTIPENLYPPRVSLDYEAILRANNPKIINYNTQLRSILPKDVLLGMDELYGKIYDKQVLLKQICYFLEKDDFTTIRRLLVENRFILSKEQASHLIENVLHFLYLRFYYNHSLSNIESLQLIKTGNKILNNQNNITLLDSLGQPELASKNIEVYNKTFLKSSLNEEDLQAANEEIQKRYLILRKGIFKHGCEKSKSKLNKWKYRRKVEINTITPYLSPPPIVDPHLKSEINSNFTNAINSGDWKYACLILRKYTRILEVNSDLVSKFLTLYEKVHSDSSLNEKQKTKFRSIWYTTLYKPRVIIKLLETKAHLTTRDLEHNLEEQRQDYRDRKEKQNYQRWLKKGINLDSLSYDFSDAKGYDWVRELWGDKPEPVISSKKSNSKAESPDKNFSLPDKTHRG